VDFNLKGVIAVAAVAIAAAAFACSLTIQSGEAHGLHHEVEPATAAPTPTPESRL
jgi:hypothetical protein